MIGGNAVGIGRLADPKMQIDRAMFVFELLVDEQANRYNHEAGFFQTLANGTILRRLAGKTLTAGKFCQSSERRIWTTDTDEILPGMFNDRDANWDGRDRHVLRIQIQRSVSHGTHSVGLGRLLFFRIERRATHDVITAIDVDVLTGDSAGQVA